TLSIFSVRLPHFAHWYSYNGTALPPHVGETRSIYHAAARRKRVLDCCHGAAVQPARGMLVPGCDTDRQSGGHHPARAAHLARSGPDCLRGYAPHAKTLASLQHPETVGQLP